MPQALSTARLTLPARGPLSSTDGRPVLDSNDHGSRIRARMLLSATPSDIMDAWTSAAAWEAWMRLKSRSRAAVAGYAGACFRLEIAESPLIHVITGQINWVSVGGLSLTWSHYGVSEVSSNVTVTTRERDDITIMTFVHDHIVSRREASWLMRFWPTALGRLGVFVSAPIVPKSRVDASAVLFALSSSDA